MNDLISHGTLFSRGGQFANNTQGLLFYIHHTHCKAIVSSCATLVVRAHKYSTNECHPGPLRVKCGGNIIATADQSHRTGMTFKAGVIKCLNSQFAGWNISMWPAFEVSRGNFSSWTPLGGHVMAMSQCLV